MEQVSGAKYVSILDLACSRVLASSQKASQYPDFVTPLGMFRPTVLSFGLKNDPFCFSRLKDRVLKGAEAYGLAYLDDVAIFSDTSEMFSADCVKPESP